MSKFCGKCGAKLNETTGSCLRCNNIRELHILDEINNLDIDKSDNKVVDDETCSELNCKETKEPDIIGSTVASEFCKKCGSKIDVNTGLCQKCNFSELKESIYSDNEKISVEIDYDEQKKYY